MSDELREAFCSEDASVRARAYESIGSYHGFDNLGHYPDENERRRTQRTLVEVADVQARGEVGK